MKVQTFDSALYKTERDVRMAVQGQLAALNANTLAGKAEMTVGRVIDRYLLEVFPQLRHSTQDTDRSMLEKHIRPKWGEYRLPDVKAYAVQQWLETLTFGPASKKRAKGIIKRLLDQAMLWEYIPVERNPMELIRVKGSTKRSKKLVIITPDQLKSLVDALPAPYNLIVLVLGCMGYRISEVLALQWNDIDWEAGTIVIQRVFTHNQEQDVPKTDASGNELPVFKLLLDVLAAKAVHKTNSPYVFASPVTGGPMSASTMLTDYLKPTAARLGIRGIGFHSIRHSYKQWMADAKVSPSTMKDLMRHADFSTTMDTYGNTLTPELRAGNSLVASQLF